MRRTVAELEGLRAGCLSLCGRGGGNDGGEEEEGGRVELVEPQAESCAQEIEAKVREVMEVERTQLYLQWMGKVRQLRSVPSKRDGSITRSKGQGLLPKLGWINFPLYHV